MIVISERIVSCALSQGKAVFVITLFLALAMVSGEVLSADRELIRGERPPIDLDNLPPDAYEKGIFRIKFDEAIDISKIQPGVSEKGFVSFGFAAVDALTHYYEVHDAGMTFESPALGEKFADRHVRWGLYHWFDLYVDENTDIIEAVKRFEQLNEIVVAEPHYKKELIGFVENTGEQRYDRREDTSRQDAVTDSLFFPDDPLFSDQWHYHNTGQTSGTPGSDISLPAAWAIETGNPDVIVAVIDGGIAINHPDLADNMWEGIGYNFVYDTPNISPHNHGSHVAGTIAAVNNNDTGVSGIAGGWGSQPGVKLMSAQVFVDDGFFGQSGGFELAPVYAADNGAAISQNSWGYTTAGYYEQAVLDAIDYFNANGGGDVMNGGITIFAAGNDGNDAPKYPAYYSGAMAVASTNHNDQLSWYSNYGVHVDISAPGGETNTETEQGVLSTRNVGYGYAQGTSMACPHVSGVVALMVSMAPGVLDADDFVDLLLSSTDPVDDLNPDYGGLMGTGRVNAFAALIATGMYASDPEAPAPPTDFLAAADDGGAFEAHLSWINPVMAAGGDSLSALDAINIYRGDLLIHTIDDPVMGQVSQFTDSGPDGNGFYNYTVRGVNYAGEGQPATAQTFVGHDVPAAPPAAFVEAAGKNAVISWKNPEEGFNDGFLDGENLSYDVRRYPCDVIVASQLNDTIFFDATIPEFASYYYTITAFNALGQGGASTTNESMLGVSNLLYYEPFNYDPGSLPPGWHIDGDGQANWGVSDAQTAGGQAPEMRLNSDPIFSGTSHLVSEVVPVPGDQQLKYTFRSYLNNSGMMNGAGEISASYSIDLGSSWTELMNFEDAEDYGPLLEEFLIDIPQDTDSIMFAFEWTGITWHFSHWSLDNLMLYPFGEFFEVMITLLDDDESVIPDAIVIVGDVDATEILPGGYFFDEVEVGEHTVTIQKPGYLTYQDTLHVTDDDVFETIVLIPETYMLTFDIQDNEGAPITEAVVTLNDMENSAGDYVFPDLHAGTYDYTVSREGFQMVEGTVTVDEDISLAVVMELITYQVTFSVEDQQGQSIDNAVVTLGGMENDPGDYVFEDIVPGTYFYHVEKENYHNASGELLVQDHDITETVTLEEDDVPAKVFDANDLTVFPNPSSERVTITSAITIEQIRIIDLFGRRVEALQVEGFDVEIDVSHLPGGIYLINIITEEETFTRRLQVLE